MSPQRQNITKCAMCKGCDDASARAAQSTACHPHRHGQSITTDAASACKESAAVCAPGQHGLLMMPQYILPSALRPTLTPLHCMHATMNAVKDSARRVVHMSKPKRSERTLAGLNATALACGCMLLQPCSNQDANPTAQTPTSKTQTPNPKPQNPANPKPFAPTSQAVTRAVLIRKMSSNESL